MNEAFHLDWETRSVPDLEEVGLDVYLSHPTAKITMANYARGDRKVQRWEPHLNPQIPAELEDALLDPFTTIHAWGAEFERTVTRKLLGIDKPTTEWVCVMAAARYLSLPGKLHEAGEILQLGDKAKLRYGGGKTGKGAGLVKFFGEPTDEGGEETLFGISQPLFNEPWTHPKEWEKFCVYGEGDVEAERAAEHKIRKFWMPDSEWEAWRLDQQINETGWPTDQKLIEGAKAIVLRERGPLVDRIKQITGCDNPNSRDQILDWLSSHGYTFDGLGKDFVARALNGDCDLTPEAREVLELRTQTAKSSMSKYTKLADMTSADGRLRHQYTFYGAHTGRWAAHGANMGNLFKPTKEVEKKLELAVNLVREMDYEGIKREFSKPLEVAASVQRSAFRAPEGHKFVVADLNAIENRGLGYLSRCKAILDVFREGRDPYLDFATKMFNDTYANLLAEFEAGDKTKRTICKAPVLGAGYQLGPGKEPGKEYRDESGNIILEGLQGYAAKMGIEMTYAQAKQAIAVFRSSYPEVKWLWKDMETAAAFAIRHPGHLSRVGVPHTKKEEEYFERVSRKVYDPILSFKCHSDKILELILPAGRSLFYWSPRVEVQTKTFTFRDEHAGAERTREYQQDCLFYKARDQKTKQWVETDTFGGHLVENADQAVSRDVLVNGMKLANKMGFQIVGHTYDELVTLVRLDSGLGIEDLRKCMSTKTSWGGDDFPLDASGFEDEIYRKD